MTRPPATVALIVAAGRGRRFGDELPKQYQMLRGRPVLRHTAQAFLGHPEIDAVRVVIGADDAELYRAAVGDLDLLAPVVGGAERQDSVRLGLESLGDQAPAVRPSRVSAGTITASARVDQNSQSRLAARCTTKHAGRSATTADRFMTRWLGIARC